MIIIKSMINMNQQWPGSLMHQSELLSDGAGPRGLEKRAVLETKCESQEPIEEMGNPNPFEDEDRNVELRHA